MASRNSDIQKRKRTGAFLSVALGSLLLTMTSGIVSDAYATTITFNEAGLVAGFGPDPVTTATPKGSTLADLNLVLAPLGVQFDQTGGFVYVSSPAFVGGLAGPSGGNVGTFNTVPSTGGDGGFVTVTFTCPDGSGRLATVDSTSFSVFTSDGNSVPDPRITVSTFDLDGMLLESQGLSVLGETLVFSVGSIARVEFLDFGEDGHTFDDLTFDPPECVSECDPSPLSQGYWHRQCLGLSPADGGINPSRHGRGPQFPIEPDFDKLLPAVGILLGNLVFEARACQDGIDTNPPSDQCEKAKKQLTALLFNLESGRLSVGCTVTAAECSSTNVGDAINEIAGLINSGDSSNCNAAKACAAAINEGAVSELSSLDMPMSSDATAVPVTPLLGSTGSVGGTTDVTMDAEAAPSPAKASSVIFLEGEARDVEVEQHAEPDVVETDDLLGSLERHTAVLNNPSAPEAALEVSEDALLTALSGGYEPEVRIEIVGVLIDHVDVALHDLLIRHLENLRDEAQDFEKDELVAQAERLLKRLESDRE